MAETQMSEAKSEAVEKMNKAGEPFRFRAGDPRTVEISKLNKGIPKPKTSESLDLYWMKKRLKDGALTDPQKAKLIDMMESGDKARFHIITMLMEIQKDVESPAQAITLTREMLNWAKLQYGEKHTVTQTNINIDTTMDEIMNRISDFKKQNDESVIIEGKKDDDTSHSA